MTSTDKLLVVLAVVWGSVIAFTKYLESETAYHRGYMDAMDQVVHTLDSLKVNPQVILPDGVYTKSYRDETFQSN